MLNFISNQRNANENEISLYIPQFGNMRKSMYMKSWQGASTCFWWDGWCSPPRKQPVTQNVCSWRPCSPPPEHMPESREMLLTPL